MEFEDFILLRNSKFERSWKEDRFPWTKYVANTSTSNCTGSKDDMKKWCQENLKGRYNLCVPIYFELEEDCMLFILRWC